jgi:putative ABC transport system permease protein
MNPVSFFRNHVYENLRMALDTILSNKLRSFLTVIGVVIGVITMMIISAAISGIDMGVKKEIESFGTRSIFLYKFDPGIRFGRPSREERMRKPLTAEDAEAIAQLPDVEHCVPMLDITNNFFGQKILVTGKNGKTSSAIRLSGTFPEIDRAGTDIIVEGRWFTRGESDAAQNVAVIGSSVVENFFPFGSPIGETVDIAGKEFRIIGVLQKREQFGGGGGGSDDQSNVIWMPFGTARKLKPNADDIFILATARAGRMDEAKDQISDLLRVRRQVPFDKPNNFGLSTADSIIGQFRSITQGVAIAMVVISSVGLMIGGIGVMNIMLVSVTERTREIGIRKAIGAKRSDIMTQFLIEAMTLTGIGGIIGLFVGWLLTLLIGLVFPSYVPLWAPVAGFLVSVGIGLIFGLFPAWKAARLDPIESLRYE